MPSYADILSILGPLAGILPRVFAVMAAGIAAVLCAHAAGRALRAGGPARFLGAWLVGILAVLAGWLALAGLRAYTKSL